MRSTYLLLLTLVCLSFALSGCGSTPKKWWDLAEKDSGGVVLKPAPPQSPLPGCAVSAAQLESFESFDQLIKSCAPLNESITWEYTLPLNPPGQTANKNNGNGPYAGWPENLRKRLYAKFALLHEGASDLELKCPDPLKQMLNPSWPADDTSILPVYLTEQQTFDIYAAHVAHALDLEFSKKVPWSILSLPKLERDELLASYRYFAGFQGSAGGTLPEGIRPRVDFRQLFESEIGGGLICDPRDGYRFARGTNSLSQIDLLGATEEETLANLTAWLRNNVVHIPAFNVTRGEYANDVFLKDRLRLRMISTTNAVWARPGCHGASLLMQDLARSLNIPLAVISSFDSTVTPGQWSVKGAAHRGLAFRWARPEARVVWHSDWLYSTHGLTTFFPIQENGSSPVSEAQGRQMLYDILWMEPAKLGQWKFKVESATPLIENGIDWGAPGSLNFQVKYLGRMGGYWQDHISPDATYADLTLHNSLLTETMYQGCDWGLLKASCGISDGKFPYATTVSQYVAQQGSLSDQQQAQLPVPVQRTVSDYQSRANACVQAYGGCSAIQDLYADWLTSKFTTAWSD